MTTGELLQAVQTALLNDSGVAAWCLDEFGKAPTIWLGLDEQNPPVESDYPLISIVAIDQARGNSRGEIEWQLHLGVGIVNNGLTSAGNGRTYPGMLQAENLRELAENALYRTRISGVSIDVGSSGEASSVSYHPIYVSYTTIAFSGLKSRRHSLPQ